MWDLPGPGLEPMSPALAGGFLTTEPPGKFPAEIFYLIVLESRSSRSRCLQDHAPSDRLREGSVLGLSQLLAVLWLEVAQLQSSHGVCMSVSSHNILILKKGHWLYWSRGPSS